MKGKYEPCSILPALVESIIASLDSFKMDTYYVHDQLVCSVAVGAVMNLAEENGGTLILQNQNNKHISNMI